MTDHTDASNAVPGQRWISNTEPELGLGLLLKNENRQIVLGFPAADEQRTYATANAPITRVEYQIGDTIQDTKGTTLTITVVNNEEGYLTYHGKQADGSSAHIAEIDLDSHVHFNSAKERLFAGQLDSLRAFKLRKQTVSHWQQQQHDMQGLLGPRVQLLPHQFYVAHETSQRFAPRVLLADEVGLGKTIEAGLIIHQQLLTGKARRVLIVVPESLVHQWLVEFLRRFNLHFAIFDEARCRELQSDASINPFDTSQLILCSTNVFEENQDLLEHAAQCDWDLLVVDEAHHLSWSPEEPSRAYRCIETLANKALGVLLLTATPEQLGIESHFARLRLLDPDRYHDFEKFCNEQQSYHGISELINQLQEKGAAEALNSSSSLQAQLASYIGEPRVSHLLSKLQESSEQTESELFDEIIRELLDCYGTGRIIFRNTRSAIGGFPSRVYCPHPLEPSEQLSVLCKNSSELKDALHPENVLGSHWPEIDSRCQWLVEWLKARRNEKILIICAESHTALELEEYLRLRNGIRSSVFHEEMTLLERDRAAAYFAETDSGAQILICSEIGSEGRNFQFAHDLVLFDLPLNPDLLEQRIGRLDRIGQTEDIKIHIPFYKNTAQAALLRWYHEGLNAFEQANPAAAIIYDRFADDVVQCLTNIKQQTEDSEKTFDALIQKTREFHELSLRELRDGRDPLLELNSCHKPTAEKILTAIKASEQVDELEDFMEAVFDHYGVDQEYHSEGAIIIRPGDHMQQHHFPGLTDEGITATFDRSLALSRDDMHFLNWEHPMVTGAMDMILNTETGNTSICSIKLKPVKQGTLLVETFFRLHCPAPAELQLQRFLTNPVCRILIDSANANLGDVIKTQHIDKLGEKIPKKTARQMIRHAKREIEAMLTKAEEKATQQQAELINNAINSMKKQQENELSRLQQLAKHNPNIRQTEIDHLVNTTKDLEEHLRHAQFQLDAIRLAIVT